jgi:hypothetical protein
MLSSRYLRKFKYDNGVEFCCETKGLVFAKWVENKAYFDKSNG